MIDKDYSQEFVHLVGLYTHCNMTHGTYNVKFCGKFGFITFIFHDSMKV